MNWGCFYIHSKSSKMKCCLICFYELDLKRSDKLFHISTNLVGLLHVRLKVLLERKNFGL